MSRYPAVKRFLQNSALVVASILTILILIELFLIYFMPVYIHTITSQNYQPALNPDIAYELKPFVGDHNADGIRAGVDYAQRKPDDVFRVLVAGDSLAYGLGVKLEETYAKQLEDRLNARRSSGRRYEVINLGVPGYRITQIVERIKSKGLQYKPDLIIYGFWLDDITDSCSTHEMHLVKAAREKRKLVLADDIAQQNLKNFLIRFQLARRVLLFYRGVKQREQMQSDASIRDKDLFDSIIGSLPPQVAATYLNYLDRFAAGDIRDIKGFEPYYAWYSNILKFSEWNSRLRELAELSEKHNIDLMLLMTPVLYDASEQPYNWDYLHAFVENIAGHYSIPVLDLKTEFRKYNPTKIGIGDYEHPNALGNRIIAEKLYQYLVKLKMTAS